MTVDSARITTPNNLRRTQLDLDGVGGDNDSVDVRSTETTGLVRSDTDPTKFDGTVETETETTVEVDAPRNPEAAATQRRAALAEQDRRALHFLQQAGYEPGDDIKWERNGDTVRAEVNGDLDNDGVVDDTTHYESTLRAQSRPSNRRAFTLEERGASTYRDVTSSADASADPSRTRLQAPNLGDGDGLDAAQVKAYEDGNRYTAVGADAPLEPGVRSNRVQAARDEAIDNLEAIGLDRDVATTLGGPQDEYFGPKTNALISVESQVRALHNAGVDFDTDALNAALSADDFDLESFDASAHVRDWGARAPNDVITLETGEEVTVLTSSSSATPRDAVGQALESFDDLATRGFVSREQLAALDGGSALAENLDALIFANPTDRGGAAAWSGLSRADLEAIQKRLADGDSLADVTRDAMANSSVGRSLPASFSAEDFSSAVEHRRNEVVVGEAVDAFDHLSNSDGFVTRDELASLPGGQALADRFDALIFGNIDAGNAAYNGLSREDLDALRGRLEGGERLDTITEAFMRSSHVGRRLAEHGDYDYDTFAKAVAEARAARS